MKIFLMIIASGTIFFSACKKQNYVNSATSLEPYEYDPKWDYKGYNPDEDVHLYRTYQPDPMNGMVKNTADSLEKEEL